MQSAEIELKFPVSDPQLLHNRLLDLGFRLDTPRTFEQNTLFDTPARALRQAGQLLRLREYGERYTVTHKRHPDREDPAEKKYKVRIETETEVAEGPAMEEIFRQLGFLPTFRYEKFRSEWSHPSQPGHLVVDETPIGVFAELEGPREWIDLTLADLGVDPATCLTESYGRLFLDWKQRNGSPATDLTFVQIPQLMPEPELIPS
jgi:adenylate cyclase class 2